MIFFGTWNFLILIVSLNSEEKPDIATVARAGIGAAIFASLVWHNFPAVQFLVWQ